MSDPNFPPLFSGRPVTGTADPLDRAVALAVKGSDPGIIVHNVSEESLRAAIIFAPEVPLEDAMTILPVCGLGFQAALGALAPPEVAVHLEWGGAIRVNGARCGALTCVASTGDPETIPDWLVCGLHIDIASRSDAPGRTPDETYLLEEGCAEVEGLALLEAWARHTLYWINRWLDEGGRPVHAEWRPLAFDLGEQITLDGKTGTFMGVDERFGMLIRAGDTTELIPLSSRLKG